MTHKADDLPRKDVSIAKFRRMQVSSAFTNNPLERLKCFKCDNIKFEVFYNESYETSIRCKCGKYFVVHDG